MYQCRLEAPAAHRPCTPAVRRHARVRACSHCDRSVSPRHRRSPRGGCLLAAQRYSDDAARMHLESIHAAGARRSQATGSSFGMNSRASQRADELAGADPANRAPLAHPRQLAGRSRPRIRLRGARFGDGLETDHLNGRPGGREATRCAVRPLRGAGEPSLLAPRLDSVYTGSPTRAVQSINNPILEAAGLSQLVSQLLLAVFLLALVIGRVH